MEKRPLIRRIVLENYKSIAFCDVKVGPLAVLVGPNGAGKSNFLDAIRFLSEAMQGPVEKAVNRRGGFEQVIWRAAPASSHVGFRIEFLNFDGLPGYYSVRLGQNPDGSYINEKEKCFVGRGSGESYIVENGIPRSSGELSLPQLARDSLYLPLMAAHPRFRGVFNLLDGCRFYNLIPREFLQPASDQDSNRSLNGSGSNLANLVNYFRSSNTVRSALESHPHSVLDRIIEYMQVINPQIAGLNTEAFGGYRRLQFLLNGYTEPFRPDQMSDGTLRSLAVLVALFQASPVSKVSLVGLEEPETALHPAAAGVLFDAMREASATVQVVATTHSADLLDNKEIDTESILSVELHEGATRIGHLDQAGRQALKQQLYTPGELMRMNYLRPESPRHPFQSEVESVLFENLQLV